MREVSLVGEDHGDPRLVRCFDDLVVSNRSPGLHDRGTASLDCGFESVLEREECIGCARPSGCSAIGLLRCDPSCVSAILLTCADSDRLAILG